MRNKKGISLIVLIITIIVVIILAAVVILTLSKNNPIESAKEASFKEDVRTFQDELALYISKQYANAGGHWDGSISTKTHAEIINYIPSFTKKYEGKFIINNNNLEYTNNLNEKEKEYAKSLNVNEKVKLLPEEYQQVEYIESTGTEYIDTKKFLDSNKGIMIQFSLSENVGNNEFSLCGVLNPNMNIGGYKSKWLYSYRNSLGAVITDINIDLLKHNISVNFLNNKLFKFDNTEFDLPNSVFSNSKYMYIFCSNHNNSTYIKTKCKIFNVKITNFENFIADFIPCYSTTSVVDVDGKECPSGTIGMYDTVEGKFYTNQGTGDFIAGPEV